MLTRVYLNLPSNSSLFFERRFSVSERLNLRLKLLMPLKIMSFTQWAINLISRLILWASKSTTLFSNSQFCNFMFLLDIFLCQNDIDKERVIMVRSMSISIRSTKSIKAFHTYKNSTLIDWLMETFHTLIFINFTTL